MSSNAESPQQQIPQHPDELTSPWLTEHFRASGTITTDASVRHFTYKQPSVGQAMSGVTVRLHLEYDQNRPDQPSTAIAKFAAADPVVKGLLETMDCYGREIAFYADIQPRVPIKSPRRFAGVCDPAKGAAAKAKAAAIFDKAPARIHMVMAKRPEVVMRPSRRRYALVIEDVGDDAVVHDLVTPPKPAQLEPVVTQLAHLHAEFWGDTTLVGHPALQAPLGTFPRYYRNAMRLLCRDIVDERWSSWLTPAHQRILDETHARFIEDKAVVQKPITLIHGDPRSDNLLYFGQEPVIVDWALTGFANPAYDIAYLIGSSLGTDDIAAVDGLVDLYLATLADAGHVIERQVFWSDMRACTRGVLLQTLLSLIIPMPMYGDHHPSDLWAPRLLAFLEHSER